ncbi:MAG: vanadium-dependent haloperoxidase [Acidobacteriales bacterium]|nr:vanadium-dependent haloperoxidase [Terriglobales bacterium]
MISPKRPAVSCNDPLKADIPPKGANRRQFLGRISMAAAAAGMVSSLPRAMAKTVVGSSGVSSDGGGLSYQNRVKRAYDIRTSRATADFSLPIPPHTTNGDEQRYSDKSATYSKPVKQDGIALVNPAAFASFKKALVSGLMSDYENIILGGTRTLNGPQGSYAYDLETADSAQFGNAPFYKDPSGLPLVPPFDKIASPYYGAQLIELYWGSLLRDVAFTDYANNPTAIAAAAEMTSLGSTYRGPKDANGKVTTDLLFRGIFPGETIGPYVSQFMVCPTMFGQQPLSQQYVTYAAGLDYMTDPTTFLQVQNGIDTGLTTQNDPTPRYLHNGRGLASYTNVDVLYEAYFVALLTFLTINVPINPGNPYAASKTQNGFCTFGGPDFAATVGEMGARALQKVWFQKWLVHLVQRPEAGGGVLRQILQGQGNTIQATLDSNVLNSQAVQQSFSKYGDYFLAQAFPDGSPAHPSYPTGHGTVGGACITILKFFFDGSFVLPNPVVPSNDGLSLLPYTGGDAGQITVNGELNKLAHNVTFGHGIHAGIHWRMDSDQSMLLGEGMALSYLQDRAQTYNEKFTVQIQRLDGSTATISNQ